MLILMTGPASSSSTTNNLALEGTPVHNSTTATSMDIGPFTTTKAALIVIVVLGNIGPNTISSITGGGLTWALRTNSPVSDIEIWTAPAASVLSGVTFTITPTGNSFMTADLFAISGYNTGSPYDGNASIPANSSTDPITISTDNAFDFIIGGFRFGVTASPTQGAGWTKISGANFTLTEYKIVSTAQSNLSVSVGTGAGDANGGIADAVKSA